MLQEGCFLKILIDSFRLRKWQITPSYTQTIHDCHMVYKFFFYLFHNNKLNLRGDEGRKNKCKFFSYLTATRTDDEFLSSSLIFEKILVLLFALLLFVLMILSTFLSSLPHSASDDFDGEEFRELKMKMKFKYLMSFMLLFLSK